MFFAERGVRIERVLTDNGKAYAEPRHVASLGLDDVVEERQDAAVGAGGRPGSRKLVLRQVSADSDEPFRGPGVMAKRLEQDVVHGRVLGSRWLYAFRQAI